MGAQSSTTLTQAVQGLIAKQNRLVYTGRIVEVRLDGMVIVLINGKEYIVSAISDQPFFAGSQVRVVLNDKKNWILLGAM